jgi:tetratricopeptide (TPR) repeat protein
MGARPILMNRRYLVVGVLVAALAAVVVLWHPLLIEWRVCRASRLLRERNNDRALTELRAALRIAPDRPETLLMLARTHRRLGNLERVPALVRRAKSVGGDPGLAQREMWLLLAQSGRLREAEPHLAELLRDAGDDGPDICEAYVQCYFANLRINEANQLLDAWQKDYPQDAQPHFMRAYLLQGLGSMEEAVAAYRQGLEIAPGETIMRCRMAQGLAKLGELDQAAELLRRCAEEAPQNAEVLMSWGDCFFMQGDTDQARQILEQLLDHAPDHFEAKRLLGEIELADGRFQEAVDHLQVAVDLRPYDTTSHNALGRALRGLGRADEAQPHFDYVAEAEQPLSLMERQLREVVERPDDLELRYQIGATLLKYGSPEDGAKWLRTVLELHPDHAEANLALAAYYEARGDWRKALVHRERAAAP